MKNSDEQKKLSENKFIYDSKIDFEVEARASKLFGLWAATKLGLTGDDAEKYAIEAVNINVQSAGFNDVISKIADDLNLEKIKITRRLLEVEMAKALNVARINGVLTTID